MARVKVDPDFEPPTKSGGSAQIFYLRNGVWVMRSGTIPNNAQTEAQMLERAGFAIGSRQFAYDLSPTTKAAWAAAAVPGTTGQMTMIGQHSCQWETGKIIPAFPAPGVIPDCGDQPFPIYVPLTGALSWDVNFPDAEATSEAWISAAIRLTAGQAPFTTPMKLIFRGAATDGVKTLTDNLAAVFGTAAVGAAGVDVEMRYGNPTDGW